MLRFLRWASLSYGLPPLHFTRHSELLRASLINEHLPTTLGAKRDFLPRSRLCLAYSYVEQLITPIAYRLADMVIADAGIGLQIGDTAR